jgi:FKBP-type peptidyl-prolyl cis-trans isomerase
VSTTQRVFTLLITAIFIVSTIGIVVFTIMQSNQDKKEADAQAAAIKALQEQQQAQPQEQPTKEDGKLQGTKLEDFTPTTISELKTEDTKVGTGAEVKEGETVTAHYTGAVAKTGVIFQSSYDSGAPIPFSLNGVIEGWSKGVPGMKEGGTRRIYIPANLAYGSNPPAGSGIPADADLVFDVTLVKIGE